MTTPSFDHPDNLHSALQFNPSTGEPELRVSLGSSNITITGNVNVGSVVQVESTPDNPVHTHVSEVGTSGVLAVPYMPIGGTVSIGADGQVTLLPSSNVIGGVTQSGTWNVGITGTPTVNIGTPTVNIGTIPEVEIKNDVGNPISVSGSVSVVGPITASLPGNLDAFSRLRTSNPYTLFDSQARYYNHNNFDSSTANGGTITYDANSSSYFMNVTTTQGSSAIRETKRVFPYQPGKSLLCMISHVMNTPISLLTQRVGLFGVSNGVFFEVAGTVLNFVIRSSTSGSPVETRVPQSQWNVDRLDGTGPSGITLSIGKSQIFFTDVEWLGVGTVRAGFLINGQFVICHEFQHANIITGVYMTTATLPVRFEIFTTGTTAGAATLNSICSTVMNEGGYQPAAWGPAVGTDVTPKTLITAGVYYPVASIRLNNTRLDAVVVATLIDIVSMSNNGLRWKLLLNPTLTGANWIDYNLTSSSVQYDISSTSVSAGTEVDSGFVNSRDISSLRDPDGRWNYQLGRFLNGTSDILTLAIASSGNNESILAQLGWEELT